MDVDTYNVQAAEVLVALADRSLGIAPRRTGQAPKTLLVFNGDGAAFGSNLATRTYMLPDETINRVEVLADVRQFVAYARHPVTKAFYTWEPGRGEPVTVPRTDLPLVTLAKILEYLEIAELILARLGGVPVVFKGDTWVPDDRALGPDRWDAKRSVGGGKIGRGDPRFSWCYDEDLEDVVDSLADLDLHERPDGSFAGRCPVHGSLTNPGRRRSTVFRIRYADDGSIMFQCFANCDRVEIAEEIGRRIKRAYLEKVIKLLPDFDYGEHTGIGAEDVR